MTIQGQPPRMKAWRLGAPVGRGMTAAAGGLCIFLIHGLACAQTAEPVSAVPTPAPVAQPGTGPSAAQPTHISAERLTGRPELAYELEGDAEIQRGDTVIRADRLEYYQPDDRVRASGGVSIQHGGTRYSGEQLELKLGTFEGFFSQPEFQLRSGGGHGEAERIDFLDETRAEVRNASYTTCKREPAADWLPDWLLKASKISLDTEEEVGRAEDASLEFKGATLMQLPVVSFALSDKRKSGVLPPTFGVDNISGTEMTVPMYWNIAPNRDATLFPTLMTKRGVNWGGEFRYLESSSVGELRTDYMAADKLRDRKRWGVAYTHEGHIDTGWEPTGSVGLNIRHNRVSDDDYWRDFPRASATHGTRLLESDVALNWAKGGLALDARSQRWQTLQDPTAPIVPPYDRVPKLSARYAAFDLGGLDLALATEATRFEADPQLTGQPNAQRNHVHTQISLPLTGAAGFVTPKLQVHARSYHFDTALPNGELNEKLSIPTLSLDSGLVFERETDYWGEAYVQTLEPRLFYVRTPYVEQAHLPNYDAGAPDFNLDSIYSENAFVGNDRIADNNMLTAGLTTRYFKTATGMEGARFGVAQRFRYSEQNVTLPGGQQALERYSDILVGAGFKWDTRWAFDSTVQFNPTTEKSTRSTISSRYNPSPYRVFNLAYRFQRDVSEQLDLGWQWPINDLWGDHGQELGAGMGQGPGRWYSVGRLNYSLEEGKLVDSIIGLEYDAGCWLGRLVLERLQTGLTTAHQRIMFQLEFVGFSRVGIDPLATLKSNIPNYQYLRDNVTPAKTFSSTD